MQSFRWQQIAKITDDVFNQYIIDICHEGEEITTQGLLRYHEVISNPTGDPAKHSKNVFSGITDIPVELDAIPQYSQIKHDDALTTLKEMSDENVDCVVTSPPYYGLRDYSENGQLGMESSVEEYIEKLCDIFDEVKRVLKPKGTCWVVISDTYSGNNNKKQSDKCLLQIPSRVSIEMCSRGWILRNEIIWHKPNAMSHSVKDRFTVDFEKFFFFTKSRNYYFDQRFEEITSISDKRINNGRKSYNGKFGSSLGSRTQRPFVTINSEGRNKRCVWSIHTKPFPYAHYACVSSGTYRHTNQIQVVRNLFVCNVETREKKFIRKKTLFTANLF